MNASAAGSDRLEKLLLMLSSDYPAEVFSAARAIGCELKKSGMSWHDFATMKNRAIGCRDGPHRRARSRNWRTMSDAERHAFLDSLSGKKLGGWESEFVRSLRTAFRHRLDRLSPKQVDALNRLLQKWRR